MPEKPATPKPIEEELPHVRSNAYVVFYTNFAGCARSPWDIALNFGHITESEPNKPAVVELASVVMTPQLAKALVNTLNATVKQYELENGEIPIPGMIKRASEERMAKAKAERQTQPAAEGAPSEAKA